MSKGKGPSLGNGITAECDRVRRRGEVDGLRLRTLLVVKDHISYICIYTLSIYCMIVLRVKRIGKCVVNYVRIQGSMGFSNFILTNDFVWHRT